MSDTVRHIVLYGSLRRGQEQFARLGLARRLSFVRPVTFGGTLYDLGEYPGVVLEPVLGVVHGELYRIADVQVLDAMDDYELCRPHDPRPYDPATHRGSLYRRVVIEAGGEAAFVYVFNDRPEGRRIVSGDWLRR